MKFSKVAEDFLGFMETAKDKVVEKAECLDDAIEKRKVRRDAEETFSCVSARLVENLMDLTDEEIEALPDIIKADIEELNEALMVITEIDEEILAEKGYKSCYNCDEVINESDKFCPECGACQGVDCKDEIDEEAE